MTKKVTGDLARLWIIENRAGPGNPVSYESGMKAAKPDWPRGDPKVIYAADPDRYGNFKIVDKIPGEDQPPTVTLSKRYDFNLSTLLNIRKKACDIDAQIRMGACSDPTDKARGWEKILVLEGISPAGWSLGGDMNVFEPKDREVATDEMKFTGENLYEVVQMIYAEQAASEIVQEVVAVVICDNVSCGSCGNPSNGCQKVFAVTKSHGGSPGLPGEVIFSGTCGGTWDDEAISTLSPSEDPSDAACVGEYLAVITNEGDSHEYKSLADILAGAGSWTEVTGYNASGSPNAIFALSPQHIWVVGDVGYVYKITDITAAVTATNIQDAGDATDEDLADIHGYDELNLVAVGANNAVIHTTDGESWVLVTGPRPAVALNCVFMRSATVWMVGAADGTAWYTVDSGVTWVQVAFPGSGTGSVEDIKFSTDTVGFMSHTTAAGKGRILRTIDGGNTWYVCPEGNTSVPAADSFNAIAVCAYDPNLVFAGGLADDATDGILIKGYGA